jgi:hypothetical protein
LSCCAVGCSSADDRLAELSEKSLTRQAEQNQQMVQQTTQVAQATRQLVAADAQARTELIAAQAQLQHDLQTEREGLERNHEVLEAERKELAAQRHRDPIVAAALIQAATLLACLLPIVLCLAILRALRHEATDSANRDAVERMTPARLAEQDPFGELAGWLGMIGRLAQ